MIVFDTTQMHVASLDHLSKSYPIHRYIYIYIMVACLEWWNSCTTNNVNWTMHVNIRRSFETGHWMKIGQAFPTLWRMLMSRIHLRIRLPVHMGSVPVKKPGETNQRNHQSMQANQVVKLEKSTRFEQLLTQRPAMQQHL